eukprot:TRINITY_DN38428_c0_g1_i1.p1 TRINITY_DN38428_c0_g1~~TRINITY_DN38428_c0_g1_i1.p1  ORF type:complete len:276 (+),score=62.90 TRINITY_DN38428_c0_g1_i1:56-883(+)
MACSWPRCMHAAQRSIAARKSASLAPTALQLQWRPLSTTAARSCRSSRLVGGGHWTAGRALATVSRETSSAQPNFAAADARVVKIAQETLVVQDLLEEVASLLRQRGGIVLNMPFSPAVVFKVLRAIQGAEEMAKVETWLATAEAGQRLALVPALCAPAAEGAKPQLQLHVHVLQQLPAAAGGDALLVAQKSNAGKVAGAIAQRVREKQAASLRGAGSSAMRQGLQAVVMAQGYLSSTADAQSQQLAVLVRLEPRPGGASGHPAEWSLTAFELRR